MLRRPNPGAGESCLPLTLIERRPRFSPDRGKYGDAPLLFVWSASVCDISSVPPAVASGRVSLVVGSVTMWGRSECFSRGARGDLYFSSHKLEGADSILQANGFPAENTMGGV